MAFAATHGDRHDPALMQASNRQIAMSPWHVVEAAVQRQPENATDLGKEPGDFTAASLRQWSDPRCGQIAGHHPGGWPSSNTK